jgi:murein DD-endopeptidase MepM/ murein hydrolase activator NlpD
VLQNTPGQVAAAAAGAALIGAAVAPAAASWSDHPSSSPAPAADLHPPTVNDGHKVVARAGAGNTSRLNNDIAAVKRHAQRAAKERAGRRHRRTTHATVTVGYDNPLRDISGLIPQRVDMGVDFAGSGPIYAIGDGVVTAATGASAGWPGGGWITYQLTDGPAAGEVVYVAESVRPTVTAGEKVTSSTVIGDMLAGGYGIETGWAMPDSASAESQLAEAGGISGGGPFPTIVGINFDELLQALGVPAAPGFTPNGYGTLPSRYPADWASALDT